MQNSLKNLNVFMLSLRQKKADIKLFKVKMTPYDTKLAQSQDFESFFDSRG